MFHLVEMSSCGEDEHHGQGVQSGMLPRGKNMHTSHPIAGKTSHAASNTMRTSIRKPNPNRHPKESYKRRTLIPLASQQNLERPRLVAHQADGCEEPSELNDWPEHPVFPSNGSHGAFVLGAICEEPGCAFDLLASNGQLDLWRLLHVLHPLAIYVRRTDVKPVTIHNEPDRNFVRLPGFASVMGQPRRLLSRMNQQVPLNVPKLLLGHPKIVPQFMYERLANLMTHFGLARADRLNILLIKHNVIRSCGEVEDAPLRRRHAVKDA